MTLEQVRIELTLDAIRNGLDALIPQGLFDAVERVRCGIRARRQNLDQGWAELEKVQTGVSVRAEQTPNAQPRTLLTGNRRHLRSRAVLRFLEPGACAKVEKHDQQSLFGQ